MESRRLILAIALSFLVLVGYQLLFVKKAPQAVSPAGQLAQAAAEKAPDQPPLSRPRRPGEGPPRPVLNN